MEDKSIKALVEIVNRLKDSGLTEEQALTLVNEVIDLPASEYMS